MVRFVIANFVLFQLGWIACVMGGTGKWHWVGTILVLGIVVFHLSRASRPRAELLLIALAVVVGAFWDSLLVWMNILEYQHGVFNSELAPHWIIAMWALFATTLNVSLRWLKDRPLLAIIFGAIGGPLSYFAGNRLGAVEMPDMLLVLTMLAVGWALFMPLLMSLSNRLDGYPHLRPAAAS